MNVTQPLNREALFRRLSLTPRIDVLPLIRSTLSTFQGRYAEADALLLRAMCIMEKSLGPGHPEVARMLGNKAVIFKLQMRVNSRVRNIWQGSNASVVYYFFLWSLRYPTLLLPAERVQFSQIIEPFYARSI